MLTFERPGIHPEWAAIWQTNRQFHLDRLDDAASLYGDNLDNFALHGDTLVQPMRPDPPFDPPSERWESGFLSSVLDKYISVKIGVFDIASIEGNAWDSATGVHVFSAAYTEQFISMSWHAQFPQRYIGRTLQRLHAEAVMYTALGLVLGCREQALTLARMQLVAHRRGYFQDGYDYPVFLFMFRLLADYLQEPTPLGNKQGWSEPIVNALFDAWRTPDPASLVDLCIAVCDIHTMRSLPYGRGEFLREFCDMQRVPIEILLMFKLRQMLGLDNPVIDHPLMATALGALPQEVAFVPDELIARVRARMVSEGFDEAAIVALMSDPPA
ncbi:hypothetical protein [Massilia sp. CCM 8734]|uniref:hypothetical protein n=1 Tax=Massilia sp. CCM 8734 TaxID=2609283 RepID=UPI00141E9677|nr:hypothetical protein [Massilia sp. CCM 8734]NHZ95388.1 hypothetical protein [Massilia sp. CCM 8734]